MIELNVLNSSGNVIFSFTSVADICHFFQDTNIDASSPQSFIMYLMSNYYRYQFDGVEYYLHQMNMNNMTGKITICYEPV